ncbi:MAG TPA: hypothetical protein VEH30_12600 [Terriglobales bacterium]|nr:hypothetical protein [Terriglobales bacterium]
MAPRVSLKPIGALIEKTEKKLRQLNRKSSPAEKKRIDRKIEELDLVIRRVSEICRGSGWAIVVKPK